MLLKFRRQNFGGYIKLFEDIICATDLRLCNVSTTYSTLMETLHRLEL